MVKGASPPIGDSTRKSAWDLGLRFVFFSKLFSTCMLARPTVKPLGLGFRVHGLRFDIPILRAVAVGFRL